MSSCSQPQGLLQWEGWHFEWLHRDGPEVDCHACVHEGAGSAWPHITCVPYFTFQSSTAAKMAVSGYSAEFRDKQNTDLLMQSRLSSFVRLRN
jgi:hypothetical protein